MNVIKSPLEALSRVLEESFLPRLNGISRLMSFVSPAWHLARASAWSRRARLEDLSLSVGRDCLQPSHEDAPNNTAMQANCYKLLAQLEKPLQSTCDVRRPITYRA